jgi:hypothetical protein
VAQKEYIRLTPTRQRRKIAFVSSSRSSLWLGKDHLLLVDTEGYTETYKRFYLRDIQAIMLRKNSRQLAFGIVLGAVAALSSLPVLLASDEAVKWSFGVIAGIFTIPFLWNLIAGPTCSCCLRTAVQTEELPSVSRIRRARKLLARLRPLVAEAQGQMSAEQISTGIRELAGIPPSAVTETPPESASSSPVIT